MEGLEPTRLAAPDPKSGAATNYATSAWTLIKGMQKYLVSYSLPNLFCNIMRQIENFLKLL